MSHNPLEITVFSERGINYLENQEVAKLIYSIWDQNCDKIVHRLIKKHGWYAPRHIGQEILDYLDPKTRKSFENKCWKIEGHAYLAIAYFSVARIRALGIELRKPRILNCAGCNVRFNEWSIGESTALRLPVNGKFHFCSECYRIACLHAVCAVVKLESKQEMLERLAHLGNALEAVPTITFMNNPQLHNLSDEKQIKVICALLKMPSYKDYEVQFGSWLQALIKAEILKDGVHRTARGFRCIANDGHVCLSLAEKTIDDWLSGHNISHEKEPLYPYDFRLNPSGQMRADWQVDNTFIEYAGMLDEPEYAAKMKDKKELAKKARLSLIVLEPEDVLALDKKLGKLR
jgi:hypothetical protein